MNRTLEEILNTPVEFEEGMRVFSLFTFKFEVVGKLDSGSYYPIDLLNDSGDKTRVCYTIDGRYHKDRPYRSLLTEQEAYELFPSLKPKVYEYQVVSKGNDGKFFITRKHYASQEEFNRAFSYLELCEFYEFYQPSKRERKS